MSPDMPYCPFPNGFRRDVLARKRLIGCWCSLGSPVTAEILGLAGFDWLVLDGEHALNDVLSLVPQLMALKDSRSAPVVRPPWNDAVIIKRLLDAGFYNFLVPFIASADDARHAVSAVRYPPAGIRGVSVAHRGNRFGAITDYIQRVNDHICVIGQIENRAGLEAVDDICAVDGMDALFIGPSDLAAGLGHLGNVLHPEVQAAIAHILNRCAANGKAAGILAPVEADARRYLEMGATLVAVGSDLGLYKSATQALRATYL